jgi:hypothetical protein
MGGFSFARCLILVVAASTLAVCTANKKWQSGSYQHPNYAKTPNKIIVGGSEGWHFNFSYTNWALKNGPFYLNDTLGESCLLHVPPILLAIMHASIYIL